MVILYLFLQKSHQLNQHVLKESDAGGRPKNNPFESESGYQDKHSVALSGKASISVP